MDEQREHHWNGDRLIELEAPSILSPGLEEEEPGPRFSDLAWPIVLFLLTVFTTLWAGAYATRSNPKEGPLQFLLGDPAALLKGLPFAGTLLGILVTHEFGHYLFSRIHRVPASLPLFIPGPPHFIGTFGAVIRMRSPILSRRALFDIGVAGPIAGFVVAVVALVIGLSLSKVVERGGVRTSPGRAALAAVRLVAGSRAASAGLRCGPSPHWVCGLVRAVRDLVESHPDRPARWGTRGLRALGPAAGDGGPGDAADPVGAGLHAGRRARVVPLGGDVRLA